MDEWTSVFFLLPVHAFVKVEDYSCFVSDTVVKRRKERKLWGLR